MNFAILLNVLAILVNIVAYVINMTTGNIFSCIIALVMISANVACLLWLRERRIRGVRHRA